MLAKAWTLSKNTISGFLADDALSRGAAIAYFTIFVADLPARRRIHPSLRAAPGRPRRAGQTGSGEGGTQTRARAGSRAGSSERASPRPHRPDPQQSRRDMAPDRGPHSEPGAPRRDRPPPVIAADRGGSAGGSDAAPEAARRGAAADNPSPDRRRGIRAGHRPAARRPDTGRVSLRRPAAARRPACSRARSARDRRTTPSPPQGRPRNPPG